MSTAAAAEALIRSHARPIPVPLCPEIRLWTADDPLDLWNVTEGERARQGGSLPFWGFPWAGGQALARFVLDHPEYVSGKTVLDMATGSGLVAIAAMKAGAARVMAVDIDAHCEAAVPMNAAENRVAIAFRREDLLATLPDVDMVLAGDVFYERRMAGRFAPWFDQLTRAGRVVLAGDAERDYRPASGLRELARYTVPTPLVLEDTRKKSGSVWLWTGCGPDGP